MRRKHFTQLLSTQQKIEHSKLVASARVKQAARDGDTSALHEAIARAWKLEHQAQSIRQELFNRKRERPGIFLQPVPTVFDNCQVTLRHHDSIRTVRFSTLLATDLESGIVGMDSALGRALKNAGLMSIISIATPLGEKSYQVVAISEVRKQRPARSPMSGATARNRDTHTHGV